MCGASPLDRERARGKVISQEGQRVFCVEGGGVVLRHVEPIDQVPAGAMATEMARSPWSG